MNALPISRLLVSATYFYVIQLIFSFLLLIHTNPAMAISESPKVTINERIVNVTEDWNIPAKDAYDARETGFTDPAGKKVFFITIINPERRY